jgi:hypothetical protein
MISITQAVMNIMDEYLYCMMVSLGMGGERKSTHSKGLCVDRRLWNILLADWLLLNFITDTNTNGILLFRYKITFQVLKCTLLSTRYS